MALAKYAAPLGAAGDREEWKIVCKMGGVKE